MHPVEPNLYYTTALIPALWGNCHPVFALTAIIDSGLGKGYLFSIEILITKYILT